jgi:hypothetical protein
MGKSGTVTTTVTGPDIRSGLNFPLAESADRFGAVAA